MDTDHYLHAFQKIAAELAASALSKTAVEIRVVTWEDCVVIKLLKKYWVNKMPENKPSGQGIFFSIWLSNKAIKENKILYNIHALKLRELNGYKITSREFAVAFRQKFKPFEHLWPNVSTAFGPLTLMEGWEKCNPQNTGDIIINLVNQFLKIDIIIDALLHERKKLIQKHILQ